MNVSPEPWMAVPGQHLVGVDEAGRGPLAGPVVTAAVVLDPNNPIEGLRDSKKLSASKRESLDRMIRAQAIAFSFGRAEVEEIDRLNILQATFLAMRRAVAGITVKHHLILVDGHLTPDFGHRAMPVVKGDDRVDCISAASILAKVARDAEMVRLASTCPDYGFERHKGYGTPQHLQALSKFGPSPWHRRSFEPVKSMAG